MSTFVSITRYHDFSAGHRVYGHESKCAHLHGHNYRVTFTLSVRAQQDLDEIGRVLDFSVVKEKFCQWLEDEWDHKFLVYQEDPLSYALQAIDYNGVVIVPFNPTAENMALYLIQKVCPRLLEKHPTLAVTKVEVEETRKCAAQATRSIEDE